MNVTTRKNTKPIQDFAKHLEKSLKMGLDVATVELQKEIKSNAPVLSGAYKESISVKLSNTSDMFNNFSKVSSINPRVKLVAPSFTNLPFSNSVFSVVNYASIIESGSNGRSGLFVFSKTLTSFKPRFKSIIIEHLRRGH